MKTLHLLLIMFTVIIYLGFGLRPAHADDVSGISIQNIKVQQSSVKVGDTFTVTATLINNSTVPIMLDSGTCSTNTQVPFFTVLFDNHAKIKSKNINCAGAGVSQILNPEKNIVGTSPDSEFTYIATESGTANVTVTFSYYVKNQDSTQPNIGKTISKSLLFTISDNSTRIKTITKTVLSPLKQFKSRIAANDVKCQQDLQLVFKAEDGSPACVKPDTAQKLVERGWAKEIISNQQIVNNVIGNNTLTLGTTLYDTIPFHPDVKQTINLDGISFTYTGNGSVTRGDCYGTWVNQTEAKSFSVTADNEFNENAYQCWPPSDYPPQVMENGNPVNILYLGYSFSFFDINQTAGVAWCNSDICPMGKDLYLTKHGWNFPVTYDSPSLLQFYFNANSSAIHVGQAIGVDIGDNNTQSGSIRIPFSYNYAFSASSLFPCDYGPFRVAAFEGYVIKENLNTTEPIHFYQPGDYTCQAPTPGKFWIFHPLNNTATLVCHLGEYCNDTLSSRYLSFNGYWDNKDHFHLFDEGNYTIVGGDQWGHLMIRNFTVMNSTK